MRTVRLSSMLASTNLLHLYGHDSRQTFGRIFYIHRTAQSSEVFNKLECLQDLLTCLRRAITEVRASAALHKLLLLIRYIGNRLNMQGTLDCDALHTPEAIRAAMTRYATALKINDKLFQVLDTKTYHPQGSKLIHFIVAMCAPYS
jgi:hypothetical protein